MQNLVMNRSEQDAREADQLGFPIAGFMTDLYEDAVVFIPSPSQNEGPIKGRILHEFKAFGNVSFVILLEDGTQVSLNKSENWHCYFALPENTKNRFRNVV